MLLIYTCFSTTLSQHIHEIGIIPPYKRARMRVTEDPGHTASPWQHQDADLGLPHSGTLLFLLFVLKRSCFTRHCKGDSDPHHYSSWAFRYILQSLFWVERKAQILRDFTIPVDHSTPSSSTSTYYLLSASLCTGINSSRSSGL